MEYFERLCSKIDCDAKPVRKFMRLLTLLDEIDFKPVVMMDKNRVSDAFLMRMRNGGEARGDSSEDLRCTVFEMMVSLADRIENSIMHDDKYGNRTAIWFWSMLESMGLDEMTDNYFDYDKVVESVRVMMSREYEKDGSGGGMFVLKMPREDLRKTEIWYQAMWWLTENFS